MIAFTIIFLQTGFNPDRLVLWLGVLLTIINLATIINRNRKKPWEQPMSDLENKFERFKIESDYLAKEMAEIKGLLKEYKDDIQNKFDKIDDRVEHVLDHLIKGGPSKGN